MDSIKQQHKIVHKSKKHKQLRSIWMRGAQSWLNQRYQSECLDWQYSQYINIVGKDDVNPAAPNFKQGEVAWNTRHEFGAAFPSLPTPSPHSPTSAVKEIPPAHPWIVAAKAALGRWGEGLIGQLAAAALLHTFFFPPAPIHLVCDIVTLWHCAANTLGLSLVLLLLWFDYIGTSWVRSTGPSSL
jgi:hypothetical protein